MRPELLHHHVTRFHGDSCVFPRAALLMAARLGGGAAEREL